jgi:hypothetical protein
MFEAFEKNRTETLRARYGEGRSVLVLLVPGAALQLQLKRDSEEVAVDFDGGV